MQHARGFIVGCANGWLWSPGRQSTPNSKLGKLFIDKNHTISILHMGYKVIGYLFAKQSYWYKLRGLHVCKAILLVQLRGLLFKLKSNSIGTNGAGFCSNLGARGLLLGAYWLAGSRSPDGGEESHHFTGNRNPSPGRLPAPAPAAPHNKTYFSASKANKKNIRHMNYRHW